MRIFTDNSIEINGQQTGLKVAQNKNKTVVYSSTTKDGYKEYQMPQQRYSLNHAAPASGVPGSDAFEKDIIDLLRQQKTAQPETLFGLCLEIMLALIQITCIILLMQ